MRLERRSTAAVALVERFVVDDGDVLVFFSGSKGFHVGLPTVLWSPAPSREFHAVARRFAESIAFSVSVRIDPAVYVKVQPFRAPNSRHPKTGLHKRQLAVDELLHLSAEGIVKLAREPMPFELPRPAIASPQAAEAWAAALEQVRRETEAMEHRRVSAANHAGAAALNRLTLDFIRNGAAVGDRHRLAYSAARNLGEFGCSFDLAWALLSESALDSGLPPAEVRRQIECGLADAAKGGAT